MRESRSDIIRWLRLHSRRYVAMAKRADKVRNMPLKHHAESYAECLYQIAEALAMGREIRMPCEPREAVTGEKGGSGG